DSGSSNERAGGGGRVSDRVATANVGSGSDDDRGDRTGIGRGDEITPGKRRRGARRQRSGSENRLRRGIGASAIAAAAEIVEQVRCKADVGCRKGELSEVGADREAIGHTAGGGDGSERGTPVRIM